MGKESAYDAGDTGDAGLIPGLGRVSGEEMASTSVFLPGKCQGQRTLVDYPVHWVTKSWTRQHREHRRN